MHYLANDRFCNESRTPMNTPLQTCENLLQ